MRTSKIEIENLLFAFYATNITVVELIELLEIPTNKILKAETYLLDSFDKFIDEIDWDGVDEYIEKYKQNPDEVNDFIENTINYLLTHFN